MRHTNSNRISDGTPEALLRFHLHHLEQRDEHAEIVAPRHPGEVGGSFRNEGRGLIRAAIPGRIIGSRTTTPARGCARSPCLGQKITSNIVSLKNMLFLREQLWGAFYNFFDTKSRPSATPSISVDLTGGSSAPMFGAKRPTRVSRNRPLFFP
jgi:hypothetical protein